MNYKQVLGSLHYRFDASAKKIYFHEGYNISIKHEEVLLITNITHNNTRIYNVVCEEEGGNLKNGVLTLVYDTTSMLDSDDLMILISSKNPVEDINTGILKVLENNELNSQKQEEFNMLMLDELSEIKKGLIPKRRDFKNITSAITTVVSNGVGVFYKLIVNNPSNNAITIYDGIDVALGRVIATVDPDASATPFELIYDIDYKKGLTVVTAGSANITIIYE